MKIVLLVSLVLNFLLVLLALRLLKKLRLFKKQDKYYSNPKGRGSDLYNDLTKSKDLYKLLKKELHPERFISDADLYSYAETKMMQLGEISNSYTSMLLLIEELKQNDFPLSDNVDIHISKS